MSTFNLGLPTDIPWRRICVTEDMIDAEPCDEVRPKVWQPSIAVFKYQPPTEFQPDPTNYIASYLKVAVTITPAAPEISAPVKNQLVDMAKLLDQLEKAKPVYGALLQVSVKPSTGTWALKDYPYFANFEPKKRELFEAVTDTGEVLSGSRNNVSVGKSSSSTETTQNYDIDTGWNFGLGIPGLNLSGGSSGQEGTSTSSSLQHSDVKTTDRSTERRERVS